MISRIDEELPAGRARGLHLAEDHPDHGPVTYLQEFLDGEFFVYVETPSHLREHVFRAGDWVGFIDNRGLGHASRVGKVVLEGSISCEGKSPGPKSNERFWRS